MRIVYARRNALHGMLVYACGDTIATLILGQFSLPRLIGMMLIGSTLYAWEIPTYFAWLDWQTGAIRSTARRAALKTFLALLFFNPLWVTRHLLFIALFSSNWSAINITLLRTASISWLVNIPLSIIGNFVIQVLLPLRWRFVGSAVFSGIMAIYFALSGVWFNAR